MTEKTKKIIIKQNLNNLFKDIFMISIILLFKFLFNNFYLSKGLNHFVFSEVNIIILYTLLNIILFIKILSSSKSIYIITLIQSNSNNIKDMSNNSEILYIRLNEDFENKNKIIFKDNKSNKIIKNQFFINVNNYSRNYCYNNNNRNRNFDENSFKIKNIKIGMFYNIFIL